MDRLNKITFLFLIFWGLVGCGVKGAPLPPLNPAPLGRGEPILRNAQQKKSQQKSNLKNQANDKESSVEAEEE